MQRLKNFEKLGYKRGQSNYHYGNKMRENEFGRENGKSIP